VSKTVAPEPPTPTQPNPEVVPTAKRRAFTAEYKLAILAEADAAAAHPGGIGALLRREGLYSSHLVTWRRERQTGILKSLTPHKRGPKSKRNPLDEEMQKLRRENRYMSRFAVLPVRSPLAALPVRAVIGLIAIWPCLSPVHGAQATDPGAPAFEVASIQPPGLIDPQRARMFDMVASNSPLMLFNISGQRVEVRSTTAAQLVAAAYRVPPREIVGPPWISDVRFDVEALIPPGEDPDRIPEMLRTLLDSDSRSKPIARYATSSATDVLQTAQGLLIG
jgi:transposase-like protein